MADSEKQTESKQTQTRQAESRQDEGVNHDNRPLIEQANEADTSLYVNAEGDVKRASREEFNDSLRAQGYYHPGEDFVTKPEQLLTAEDVAPSGKKKS